MTSWIGRRWTSTSKIERSIESGFRPWLIVRFPCGSRSTSSTFSPCSANATPRFRVVVVFATPPFWLANEITRGIGASLAVSVRIPGRGSRRASPIESLLRSHASYPSGKFPEFQDNRFRAPLAFRNLRVVEDGSAHRRLLFPWKPTALGATRQRLAAPPQCRLGQVRPGPVGLDPRLGLVHQGTHLRQQPPRRRPLPLEGLDAPQPPQNCPGFVHTATLA